MFLTMQIMWNDHNQCTHQESVSEVYAVWAWDLLAVIDTIALLMYYANLKSGIGFCIAPKAGIARHLANGMRRTGMFLTFWLAIAPDQGIDRAT